jgi:hypothetical protein
MKKAHQVVVKCLIITICASVNVAAQTTDPPVSWFDDFLGIDLHPGYSKSLAGSGFINMTSGVGGVVVLAATGTASGAARLRLGEDVGTGPVDVRPFSATKNMVYKARVLLNLNTNISATVGLIGQNDPQHVIAAIYHVEPGQPAGAWGFQVVNGTGNGGTISTGFTHTPGAWFTVKIVTQWGVTPSAKIYINDDTTPLVTVTGASVPDSGLCTEFQVWNKQLSSGFSQPSLYVDYLSVTQDR